MDRGRQLRHAVDGRRFSSPFSTVVSVMGRTAVYVTAAALCATSLFWPEDHRRLGSPGITYSGESSDGERVKHARDRLGSHVIFARDRSLDVWVWRAEQAIGRQPRKLGMGVRQFWSQ